MVLAHITLHVLIFMTIFLYPRLIENLWKAPEGISSLNFMTQRKRTMRMFVR